MSDESKSEGAMARVFERAAQAQARSDAAAQTGGQLPLFPEEDTSALPNYIARTPLFAPIQPGRRKMHDDAVLPSPEGFEVRFSGKQLDMADQDVFMLALRYAQGVDLNQPVRCDRAEFLRDLGWVPGKNGAFGTSAYAWLDQSFKRLTTGTLHIKTKRYTANLSLVAEWTQDNQTGMWEFTIGGKVRALFANNEYAFVDLAKRQMIEHRVDLAKWLQSYASTHEPGIHRVSVENLKKWCGYTSPTRKFREALTEALGELERLKILINARLYREGQMVQWTRLSPVG
ncbi:plasmid replication initiator TrfA [Ralstonia condita]|nr:plasmid replication initiator TrfA [Ralstonia sp. LMG 7141]